MKSLSPFLIIVLLLISACSPQPQQQPIFTESEYPVIVSDTTVYDSYPAPTISNQFEQDNLDSIETEFPKTEKGKAYLKGILYSYTVNSVVASTGIYLTSAVGNNKDEFPTMLVGPQESRGDITTITDLNGKFEFNDIEPGNYYLITWVPLSWSFVEYSENDKRPMLIRLAADQQLDLGTAFVSWP